MAAKHLPSIAKSLPVQRCTLVGECYIEGEVGWQVGDEGHRKYKIFALR